MVWVKLTPVDGPVAYFNADNIAYVAEAPEAEQERGAGAGVSMIDNTRDVIPVYEELETIRAMIRNQETTCNTF